jgi:hypothetical protein
LDETVLPNSYVEHGQAAVRQKNFLDGVYVLRVERLAEWASLALMAVSSLCWPSPATAPSSSQRPKPTKKI